MFADACEKARQYTWPVIISVRFWNGTVESTCGAFVILNKEGWIATAAHMWDSYSAQKNHNKEIEQYEKAAKTIEQDPTLRPKQRRKRLGKLRANPKWITDHSFWWGRDGTTLTDIKALPKADLVVGRLDPFDSKWVSSYPALKDPARGLRPGQSLCRLGYPFYMIQASFDESTKRFVLPEGTLPLPFFPLEGIYTRNILLPKDPADKYQAKFLETSSPGLRGQSGGPVFDVHGAVWAIQSRTKHYELGFSPKVKKDGKEVEENQFLNVGWGVHPEVLLPFLRDNGINITLAEQ